MTSNTFDLTSCTGAKLQARLLHPGDRYGLDGCMVWDAPDKCICNPAARAQIHEENKNKLGVEFYDMDRKPQFISRYYAETLLGHGPYGSKAGSGLMLYGGEPAWSISPKEMEEVREWLRQAE